MNEYYIIDLNNNYSEYSSLSINTDYTYQSILNSSFLNDYQNEVLNGTTKSNLLMTPTLTVIFGILSGLMSLTTIIGNILVITAFIIDKNLRSYSNYFILNLSIADLLIGLLIPPYAPFLLANRKWVLGRVACTVWLVLDYVVGSASVLCIVVISLDRYLLVSGGLSYVSKQKVSRAICMMATVWIIAFINYAPAIVFWELISGKSTVAEDDCQVQFHDNLPYLTATACVEFFVPLISICVLNLAVYLNIRKRSKGLIRTKNPKFCLKDENNKNGAVALSNNNHNNSKKTVSNGDSITVKCEENKENKSIKKVNFKTNNNKLIKISNTPSTSTVSDDALNIINNDLVNSSSFSSAGTNKQNEPEKQQNDPIVLCSPNASTPTATTQNTPIKRKQVSAKSSLNKDKKAARSLFILVFAFVCCWVIVFLNQIQMNVEYYFLFFFRLLIHPQL
jgi:hypothetical protein